MKNTRKKVTAAVAATDLRAAVSRLDRHTRIERTNGVLQAWRSNMALRACSVEARGLWIDMVSIMHDCEPYGHLTLNGEPMGARHLAHIVGESHALVDQLLSELWRAGVFGARDGSQVGCKGKLIYSREMVHGK